MSPDQPLPSGDEQAVWVRTQPSTSGRTYVVSIDFNADTSATLNPAAAAAYASGVLTAAMRAAHDAGVFTQLTERGIPEADVARTILDLRNDRPDLPSTGTSLALVPGVNPQGVPFLVVEIDGKATGQWTVEDGRNHATHVLEAVHAADLDAAYHRYLMGVIGLDNESATAAVDDLAGRVR